MSVRNSAGRHSGLELLRIVSIFGIILMHSFGRFYGTATGGNLVGGLVINTVFNCSVSCFMLISGYFGIKPSVKKTIAFWLTMLLYSLVYYGCGLLSGDAAFSLGSLKCACLPVTSQIFWYMTVYFIFMVLALPLKKLTDALTQREFLWLIVAMLFLFGLIPTVLRLHLIGDNGKNAVSMLMTYFIGRYIGRFHQESNRKWWLLSLAGLAVGFGLNAVRTFILGSGVGVNAPFAEDDSLVVIFCSLCIFMTFKQMRFSCRAINFVAAGVPGIYMLEQLGRDVGSGLINWDAYGESQVLIPILAVYALCIFAACFVIDLLRRLILDRPTDWFAGKCELLTDKIWQKLTSKKE